MVALPSPSTAQTEPGVIDVTLFGGVMNKGDFPGTGNLFFAAPLEDNFLAGLAFNHAFLDLGKGFHLGGELGLVGRFGDGGSAEIWFGPSLRHDGFRVGPVKVSFGLVAGFSAVTDTIGIERKREAQDGGDASFLYYGGPEVRLTFDAWPEIEIVLRAHHRSGGKNVPFQPAIGNMGEAANAYVVGIRKRL